MPSLDKKKLRESQRRELERDLKRENQRLSLNVKENGGEREKDQLVFDVTKST